MACPVAAPGTFPWAVWPPDPPPCDGSLAGRLQTRLQSKVCLFLPPVFLGEESCSSPSARLVAGGMVEENPTSQQEGVIQCQGTAGPCSGLLSHRSTPSKVMLLQPHAFAYLSHPQHVNKDQFELFILLALGLTNNVRIKPRSFTGRVPGVLVLVQVPATADESSSDTLGHLMFLKDTLRCFSSYYQSRLLSRSKSRTRGGSRLLSPVGVC